MKIIRFLLSLILSPLKWARACIKRDRFRIYPGQIVQFIGLQGTGKTMSAHCMIWRSKKMYKGGAYATEDAGSKICEKIIIPDLARYKFRYSLFLIDESSLNGFDAREWQKNFKGIDGKNVLRQLKLNRHYHNSFITTSQNAGDNDSKIRGMSRSTWVCHNKGKYILTVRAVQWFEWQDGNYLPHLDEPSLLDKITDPYCWYLVKKKKYGKMYDTYATVEALDILPDYKAKKST